jgi:hypothetical protein
MLLDVISRRAVTVYFAYYMGDLPYTSQHSEAIRPDFLLPDYKIIIEVAGTYWHTREDSFLYDYQRALWLAAAGYTTYYITDIDILSDPEAALDSIPELRALPHGTAQVKVGWRPQDPRASLAARARKYPKVVLTRHRDRVPGRQGVRTGFRAAGSKIKAREPFQYRLFTHDQMDHELEAEYRKYGQDWIDYMYELRHFFSSAQNRGAYPSLLAYFEKWWKWWELIPGQKREPLPWEH